MAGRRVLIVEDEMLIARDLEQVIEGMGYVPVGIVGSGEEAVKIAGEAQPDLVLMDILLKGPMDGIEAAGIIGARYDIPVVYLTAYSDRASLDRLKITQPYGYLTKPFVPAELHGTIETALYKHAMERKLKESEDRYRRLFELSPHGIIVTVDQEVIFANPAAARTLGAEKADDISGMKFADLVHHEDRSTAAQRDAQIYAHGQSVPMIEQTYLRLDGRPFVVETISSPFAHEGKFAVQTVFQDISSRKEAEQALDESRTKYRLVVDNAHEGIFVLQDNRIRFANPKFCELTGRTEASLLNISLDSLIVPEDRVRVAHYCRHTLSANSDLETLVFRLKPESTAKRWIELRAVRVQWDAYPAILGFANDITTKMQAEELVSAERGRFRKLAECAPFGMAVVDAQGVYLYVNPAFTELLGYDLSDIPNGREWFRKAYPDRQKRHEAITAWMKDTRGNHIGSRTTGVYEVRTKDGTYRTMRLQRAAFDTGEHLLICEDITDRERVQNALIESEERYRLLTDNSLTGIYIHQDGKFVFVNERLCQILGYPASEIIGQYFWEFVHEDDRRMVRERGMARSRARSTPTSHYEFRVLCRDGTTRWVDVLATTITYQGRPANMGNLADITERKQAEERLIATQGLLTAAVEQSPAGILVADAPDVRIRLANSAALGIRGETTDPLLQIPLDLHPGNWQTFRLDGAPYEPEKLPLSRAILEGKTVNNVEVIIRRRDGEDRHVLANAAPVRNRSGKIVAGVVVFLDITDRLRLEEQLRQAAKMEAIGQLAGGVAHDFNNVLTAIIGYADLLAGQVSEDSARERVAQIGRAAETAAALTRQLLAFGRKQMLDIRVLNLNHCIQAVLPILQRLIGENIRIQTDLDFSIPHIRADPRQMEQIIMNLAVNARDAMPNGGQLAIETSEEHIRASQIPEQQDIEPGHHVVLKVADSGQGMDPYTKFRIFDPFFTTKGKGLGTGLGLSTVYGIVKQHRGHISVLSEPDHGTVFRLYFPRAEGPAEEPSTGQSPVEPTTTGATVLVIEDEEIVRDLTCDALNMLGYTPLTAADGEEAWRVCSTHPGPIDLVLTDVVLPETDGRSLFSRLCTVRPAMKVLYMSGYAESEIVGRGLIGGGVNFLQKPFSLRTLSQKLKDSLRST